MYNIVQNYFSVIPYFFQCTPTFSQMLTADILNENISVNRQKKDA